MVSPVVALIAVGALIFGLSRVGSLTEAFGISGSDLVGENQQAQQGEVTTDSLQNNPSIPTKQGSQNTIAVIQSEQILRTDIRSKQKFNQTVAQPQIKTAFFDLKSGGSDPQIGITVTSNTSSKANSVLGLNAKQVQELRAQPFTKQEQIDIANLTTRFNSKSAQVQKFKDSPQEVIFKKREQEAIAKQVLGGSNFVTSQGGVTRGGTIIPDVTSLFGKANFALGGKTREEFDQQQLDKIAITKKTEENALLRAQAQQSGEQVLQTINKSGFNQKQFLFNAGINLQGSDLSAVAIGKLQAKGISFSPRVENTIKQADIPVPDPVDLTSDQVRALTDAEKIARFRAGNRFT
jgi:hypothetical protein